MVFSEVRIQRLSTCKMFLLIFYNRTFLKKSSEIFSNCKFRELGNEADWGTGVCQEGSR
jgi:hypothetical protein